MAENIGMMSGAYFVSKKEILNWLNDFFGFNYTKIEQCASAVAYVQVLHSIYPTKVPLHKVNFSAKVDYEWVSNYKVLQTAFDKCDIKRHVPVDRLIKGKYQDNLEMIQWIKNLWDVRYGGQEYDGVAAREAAMARQGKKGRKKRAGARPARAARPKPAGGAAKSAGAAKKSSSGSIGSKPRRKKAAAGGGADSGIKQATLDELNERLTKLRETIEGLETERNFYFGKLREIEVLVQGCEDNNEAVDHSKVLDILYRTDDQGAFQAPEDEAEEEELDDAVQEEAEDEELFDEAQEEDAEEEDLTF